VAIIDLVGDDAHPFDDHSAHELGGEEAVAAAKNEPGGHIRPPQGAMAFRRARPGRGHRRFPIAGR